MIKVGTASAEKGAIGKGFLKIGEMSVHSDLLIPVLIVNGKKDGPTLWIAGTVHGDEISGFMPVREVGLGLDPEKLSGTLICTPLCNPLATQHRQKGNPFDSLDLDQQFPGFPDRSYSERLAYLLFREIKEKANYLISFHTVRVWSKTVPYTVYKMVGGVKPEINQETERIARIFGNYAHTKVDISTAKGELAGQGAGALDVQCILHGIPAFMVELGTGDRFEDDTITIGVRGIKNVMKYLKMVPGEPELPGKQLAITKRRFLYSNRGGFMIMDAKPGDIVRKGERIAHVVDLFSELEVFEAKEDSFIILGRIGPIIHTGDTFSVIGTEWHEM